MRKPHTGIAAEGLPFLCLGGFLTLYAAVMDWEIVSFLLLALTLFTSYFFRDPERVVPVDADVAVSPADGKVVRIAMTKDPRSGEERMCISVFMSVFNVHVNRAPVEAAVEDITYIPGKFINASFDKASTHNERCVFGMRDCRGQVWTVVQIAGLIARRIVVRADPGDKLGRGERFGIIRFGSRVDLYLPEDYHPTSQIGDAVVAGQSIVARRNAS